MTCDLQDGRLVVAGAYADQVAAAGGMPVLLPCVPELAAVYADRLDAFVLTGGDDPIMEPFGRATHPKARPIDPRRQAFELALLRALEARPQRPVLGVCLGMQLMGLHAGGDLDQHLPDALTTAGDHWGRRTHAVEGELGRGVVHSHHRQAIRDPGALRVVARAADGVIEAVQAADRHFYLGVQWHPERTGDAALGIELFRRLVRAASGA
jgi:gamma-glutamyl-gamma-aminobutyrate hydrolase PuuD